MSFAVPFTLDAITACDAWRQHPVWPRPLADTREMLQAMLTGIDEAGRSLPDPLGDIVALATQRIASAAGAYAEAAMLCESAAVRGMRLAGSVPGLAWLLGETSEMPWREPAPSRAGQDKASLLRRAARTLTLNAPLAGPAALLAPQHVAVTHNNLLKDVARRSTERIGFKHARMFYDEQPVPSPHCVTDIRSIVGMLTDRVCASAEIAEPFASRFRTAAETIVTGCLQHAARDMARIRASARLPESIWCGTGSHYPTRTLALAVRSRGGEVTGFDHGGCSGLFEWEALRFSELRAATRFVTATEAQAGLIRQTRSYAALPERTRPQIVGHDGDPTFAATMRIPTAPRRSIPRVMYVIGPYVGFRQWYPPLYPDPIYHHLLLSIAAELSRMPIDLVCRPRPAAGGRHPVDAIATCDYRPFHSALGDANVVVFDDLHSTAFWETLCTDKPVVLIDLGYNKLVPEVEAIVRSRVRIVGAPEGPDCVPLIDRRTLEDAVTSARNPADPAAVIALLAQTPGPSAAIQPILRSQFKRSAAMGQ